MSLAPTRGGVRICLGLRPCLGGHARSVLGATITQWNFNTTTGVNNAPTPSIGTGSATPVGMNGGANNADILAAGGSTPSSDLGVPNNAWRVEEVTPMAGQEQHNSSQAASNFNVSTAGTSNIVASFDVQATDGSPRHGQFQYTVDGANFTSFGSLIDFNASFDGWATFSYDLSSIPAVNNNPLFGFKLVSAFSPVGFSNTNGVQPANTAFQRASGTPTVYNGTAGNWRIRHGHGILRAGAVDGCFCRDGGIWARGRPIAPPCRIGFESASVKWVALAPGVRPVERPNRPGLHSIVSTTRKRALPLIMRS